MGGSGYSPEAIYLAGRAGSGDAPVVVALMRFACAYFGEYRGLRKAGLSCDEAYRAIGFEVEARAAESQSTRLRR